jgi:hypothetical protein
VVIPAVIGALLFAALTNSKDFELGSAGEWFSGLGGLLAVGVAGWFGLLEYRRANEERAARQEAERKAEERALQLRAHQFRISVPGGPSSTGGQSTYAAWINSTASYSFYDVVVTVIWPDATVVRLDEGELGPNSERRVQCTATDRDGPPTWTATFTDIEGNRWRTDPRGNLERLS